VNPKFYVIIFAISKRNVFLPVSILKSAFKSFKNKIVRTLKTHLLRYISIAGLLLFFIACSTKKNTFLSRNSHALSSKYNILYNGGLALDKGIVDLKSQYQDNFWQRIPIERMQINKDAVLPGDKNTTNPNFERAETKATKAIQKHSMNIGGSEKNPQMDEAHLMLGKARYYDQRFVPALEAFNYILYKYPKSDKIYEAKIWREKTNMRMDNDALAVTNLNNLLKEIKFKDQIFADANATLAQAFLNLEEKDSAVVKLQFARDFTEENEEKARYYFILGQLYDEIGLKDSAYASYQSVIDMNRKAARQYVIQAHASQAAQFDYKTGDTLAFVEKYKDLLKDRDNRPYLDMLNHQMALFYDKQKNYTQAKKYYNKSLKVKSQDQYMIASNYRNLADIYFNEAKYVSAGKYYDSTMVQLDQRGREFKSIKKKRENLNDVIKYEGIATRNDSIISVYNMSEPAKIAYYNDYIEKLRKQEALNKILQEKAAQDGYDNPQGGDLDAKPSNQSNAKDAEMAQRVKPDAIVDKNTTPISNSAGAGDSNFYFYNPTTMAFGKNEFRKNWGDRKLRNNWRVSAFKGANNNQEEEEEVLENEEGGNEKVAEVRTDEMYTADYYINQLPKTKIEIDSIAKERNFAYYQLGVIYKEKFKEYQRAADKLEKLLESDPEERLVLPAMYNLYKIYEIIDKDKAMAMKNSIVSQYPDSRYAQILSNPDASTIAAGDSPEVAYQKLYNLYDSGDFKKVLFDVDLAIDQFTGEEIVPKFELIKSATVGRLSGLEEYKKTLNYVALNYPNSEEGKIAEGYLAREVPQMEALNFNSAVPTSFKILYKADNMSDKNTVALYGKIVKFVKERSFEKIAISVDIYTMDKNFIVIHGMKNEDHAKGIASILKEFKDYKIQQTPYIISNDNYKIVQIKKNFEEWLPIGNGPIVLAPKAAAPAPKANTAPPEEDNRQRARENQRKREDAGQISDPDPSPNFAPPGMMQPPAPEKSPQTPKR
jgi:tetratricopeptide (TPR) repeat protein